MTRTVAELVVLLAVGGAASLVALVVTVGVLVEARRDLAWVLGEGIGNGRLAAARGEARLAWIRLGQAAAKGVVMGALVYVGLAGDTSRSVSPLWTVVVVGLVVANGLVCAAAMTARRTRRRVLHLGVVDS